MKNIQSILIVILVLIILFMKMCTKPEIIDNSTIEYKDSLITFTNTVIKKEIQWKYKRYDSLIYIKEDIDTAAILRDHFTKYAYDDVVEIDTLGYILIEDTIYKNRIQYRSVSTYLKTPYIYATKEVLTYSNQFYIGLGMTGNLRSLDAITGNLLFVTKRQKAFSIGAGINKDLQPVFTGRIYWNLK